MEMTRTHSGVGTSNAMQQLDQGWMYFLGLIPFMPHWLADGVFVAPGGVEWSEDKLIANGAIRQQTFMWPRHWQLQKLKEKA